MKTITVATLEEVFGESLADEIREEISQSDISFGDGRQTTIVSKNTLMDDFSPDTEKRYRTFLAAIKDVPDNVMFQVEP